MDFDGAIGNDGAGIGIWVRSPFSTPKKVPSSVRVCSYKLAFECSNNEAEYEALIAGLKILRKMNAKRISVYGDSELVIK
jgi:ribonuclease HI